MENKENQNKEAIGYENDPEIIKFNNQLDELVKQNPRLAINPAVAEKCRIVLWIASSEAHPDKMYYKDSGTTGDIYVIGKKLKFTSPWFSRVANAADNVDIYPQDGNVYLVLRFFNVLVRREESGK